MKNVGFRKIEDMNKEVIISDRERKIKNLLSPLPYKLIRFLNNLYEPIRQVKKIGREENQIHILAQK